MTRRLPPGQIIGGRYRLGSVLGDGGMGTVYDGEHIALRREVAIKILNPSQRKEHGAVERFQQEARAAGAIGHPNICEVHDLGVLEDGTPYLVMEKLVGKTLAERIAEEKGGLPFDEVVEVMIQVASGLVAAHEKGIVHRDIKPENIFLARHAGRSRDVVKILDFGISKMMAQFQDDDGPELTVTGIVMGTPYYLSPEQASGERLLDGRVDVYACGVLMYQTLAGKLPFLAPHCNALLLAIIAGKPQPLQEARPSTPRELVTIVARAMEKNREERYASMTHLLSALQALSLTGSGSNAAARLPAPPTPEERRRARVLGGSSGGGGGGLPADEALTIVKSPSSPSSPPAAPSPRRLPSAPPAPSPRRLPSAPPAPSPPSSRRQDDDHPDYVDEVPTAIFRPPSAPPSPRSWPLVEAPSEQTRWDGRRPDLIESAAKPPQRESLDLDEPPLSEQTRWDGRRPAEPSAASATRVLASDKAVNVEDDAIFTVNEWEGETIINPKKPSAAPPKPDASPSAPPPPPIRASASAPPPPPVSPPIRPSAPPSPDLRTLNVEETVKLDGGLDIDVNVDFDGDLPPEIDFSADTRVAPPRRR